MRAALRAFKFVPDKFFVEHPDQGREFSSLYLENETDQTRQALMGMARPERFELPTDWFEASYSIQLSYGRSGLSEHVRIISELPRGVRPA